MKLKYTEEEWNALSAEEQNKVMDKLLEKQKDLLNEINILFEELDEVQGWKVL